MVPSISHIISHPSGALTLSPVSPGTWDIAQKRIPQLKVTLCSLTNQVQMSPYDLSWQFVCDTSLLYPCSFPSCWLVIDTWWLKRLVWLLSSFLRLSLWMTSDWWLHPPYKMNYDFSISYTPLLRVLYVIACKLGSVLVDGHPHHLTQELLYELNLNSGLTWHFFFLP